MRLHWLVSFLVALNPTVLAEEDFESPAQLRLCDPNDPTTLSTMATLVSRSVTDKASDSTSGTSSTSSSAPTSTSTDLPKNFGIVVFQAFELLDVFGPLEALGMLAKLYQLNLYIIAESLDLVSTQPKSAAMNALNSSFFPQIQPTHTWAAAPEDVDVLIIPGGLGTRSPYLTDLIEYVKTTYPKLQYLMSICTGASIVAKAGVLDGRRATTNKAAWASTIASSSKVEWVTHARWVVDGNVWTSSGISAGIDATLAFIESIYGSDNATYIANMMEYERHTNSTWDPFADLYGLE